MTGKPDGVEWTSWDYALARALQHIEDHTDQNGLLIWEKDSERVEIEALRKTDKFQAQVDRITGGKNYKRRNGEYFTPRIVLRGGEYPTYSEYVTTQIQEALDSESSEPDDDDKMTYTS